MEPLSILYCSVVPLIELFRIVIPVLFELLLTESIVSVPPSLPPLYILASYCSFSKPHRMLQLITPLDSVGGR